MPKLPAGRFRCKAVDGVFELGHCKGEGVMACVTWECVSGERTGSTLAQNIVLTTSDKGFGFGLRVLTAAGWNGSWQDCRLPSPVDVELVEDEYAGKSRVQVSKVWPCRDSGRRFRPESPLSSDQVAAFDAIHRRKTIEAIEKLKADIARRDAEWRERQARRQSQYEAPLEDGDFF